MTYRKNILSKIVLAILGVSIAASLIGAKMDSGLPTVEVEDIADGTADDLLGWDGSGNAVSVSTDGVKVYNSSNISISNSSDTSLTFNTEYWDDNTLHDTSTNPGRLIATVEGRYLICGGVSWSSNATGNRNLSIRLNGTDTVKLESYKSLSGSKSHYAICVVVQLAAAEYAELMVFQNSGGSLNVERIASRSPEFMMQRLRSQ